MNLNVLENIGLTKGEIKVYSALIELGSSTSGPITDKSGVSRSKIYNILERLMKKGLVSYIIKEKTRYYQAEDPSKIQNYLDAKEKELKENREKIFDVISQLKLKQNKGKSNEAQIFFGFNGIKTVHEHMYEKLKRGESFYYIGIPSFQEEKYHIYWEKDHKRREKSGITSKALFNKKTEKKILKNRNSFKLSEARYMPLDIETPAWIMGYKNVTVIGLQSDEGMAIEIINEKIANSFQQYFDALWKLSGPFK